VYKYCKFNLFNFYTLYV